MQTIRLDYGPLVAGCNVASIMMITGQSLSLSAQMTPTEVVCRTRELTRGSFTRRLVSPLATLNKSMITRTMTQVVAGLLLTYTGALCCLKVFCFGVVVVRLCMLDCRLADLNEHIFRSLGWLCWYIFVIHHVPSFVSNHRQY